MSYKKPPANGTPAEVKAWLDTEDGQWWSRNTHGITGRADKNAAFGEVKAQNGDVGHGRCDGHGGGAIGFRGTVSGKPPEGGKS